MEVTAKQIKFQKAMIILSHIFGKMGSSIFSFGIGLMILRETGSATSFGFSQVVGPVIALLLLPFTGSMVDRFHHKKIVVTAQLGSISGILLFLVANSFSLLPRLSLIYILLTVLAVTDLFLETTYSSSLISMVAKEEVQKMMSIKQIVSTVVMVGSPIIGAILYKFLRFEHFVMFEVATEVITLLFVLAINFYLFRDNLSSEEEDKPKGLRGMLAMFGEGLSYVKNSRVLLFTLIYSMSLNLLFAGYTVGIPFVEIKVFQFSDTQYGIVRMMFALGMLVAGILLAKKTDFINPLYAAWKMMFLVFGNLSAFSVLIYFNYSNLVNFIVTMLIILIFGGLLGVVNIPIGVWMTKNIPQTMQGRIFNLLGTMSQVLMPLGVLFYGALFDSGIGADVIFFVTALVGAGMSFLLPGALGIRLHELGNEA